MCLTAIGLRREKFVWQFLLWNKKIEQRVCLKFCVSNGITAMESLKMLQKCSGESTLSKTQVFEWHEIFSEGREFVENLPYAIRPSTSVDDDNIEKVKKIVLENRRVGIREVAEALNISYGSTLFRSWIDSTHCGSCFGYEARRHQIRTERPEFFAKRTSGRGRKRDACQRS